MLSGFINILMHIHTRAPTHTQPNPPYTRTWSYAIYYGKNYARDQFCKFSIDAYALETDYL